MDIQKVYDGNRHYIQSDQMYLDNNYAWFIDRNENVLYKWNIETEKCEYVAHLPASRIGTYRIHTRCVKHSNYIYCLPDRGNCIWEYNLYDKSFKSIEIVNVAKGRVAAINYWEIDDELWILLKELKVIIVFSFRERRVKEVCDLILDEDIAEDSAMDGEHIYIASAVNGKICAVNIKTYQQVSYKISQFKHGIGSICCCNTKIIVSGKDGRIYLWDKDSTVAECITEKFFDANYSNETPVFCRSVMVNNQVLLFPSYNSKFRDIVYVKSDKNVGQITIREDCDVDDEGEYSYEYTHENRMGIVYSENVFLYEVDIDKNIVKPKKMLMDKENIKSYWMNKVARDKIVNETRRNDIRMQCEFIDEVNTNKRKSTNFGSQINKFILSADRF